MIHVALSSSTLTNVSVEDVINISSTVGANGIEWVDKKFVPIGDEENASNVMEATLRAEKTIVSYNTRYDLHKHDIEAFKKIFTTSRALNSPIIHLNLQAESIDEEIVTNVVAIGDMCGDAGVTACLNFDFPDNIFDAEYISNFMATIDHPFIKATYRIPEEEDFDSIMEDLYMLKGIIGLVWVNAKTATSFDPAVTNVDEKTTEWFQYLDMYDEQSGNPDMTHYVLIEAPDKSKALGFHHSFTAIENWSIALRKYHKRRVF